MKKGFTLIELLAVIVILAIIALIATPIILGIIESTRKDAFQRSVELVINATDVNISNKIFEENYTYTITNGAISDNVNVNNTEGMNGNIIYDKDGNVNYAIHNDKWCVIKSTQTVIKDYVENECTLYKLILNIGDVKTEYKLAPKEELIVPIVLENGKSIYRWTLTGEGSSIDGPIFKMGNEDTTVTAELKSPYEDGYPLYYDVATGKRCTNYHPDNSKTEYNGINGTGKQNSCLKFYVFNYNEGDELLNLLLDHNTTATIYWTNANTISTNGPKDAKNKLYADTSSWVGTKTPSNYTVSQEGYGNYTIEYDVDGTENDYKARFIRADEIAKITGADDPAGLNFDEKTSGNVFYFDSLSSTKDNNCKIGNTSGCQYGWLYDRTSIDCVKNGCLNNSEKEVTGYWTGTSKFGSAHFAWCVQNDSKLCGLQAYFKDSGIRPVIEVLLENL